MLQGWFTLAAASIAAVAAIAAAILAAVGAAKARRWTGRDHWWQRFVWAVETAAASDGGAREVAIMTIKTLTRVDWGQKDDNEIAMRAADLIAVTHGTAPPPEPDKRRWMR